MSNKDLETRKKELEKNIQEARNELYVLNEEHVKQLKAKCEERIGEAYKIVYDDNIRSVNRGKTYYLMIIDTDEIKHQLVGNTLFNQYQFKVLIFSLDDIGKEYPIKTEMRHLYKIINRYSSKPKDSRIRYDSFTSKEITMKEFLEKAREAHDIWTKNITEV